MYYKLKYKRLLEAISSSNDGAVVAFSGGVDSFLLLKATKDIFKENVLAITGCLSLIPSSNLKRAKELTKLLEVEHLTINTGELKNENFVVNSDKRCYFCKQNLYKKIKEAAKKEDFYCLFDGTNADDENEFRPGRLAAKELGARSPLAEVGLKKKEIRKLLKDFNLPDWDKPSDTCLATRVPCGERITPNKLRKIEAAEEFLKKSGFKNLRVRLHNEHTARIEVEEKDVSFFLQTEMRSLIWNKFHHIGFDYVSLNLRGRKTAVSPTMELRRETRLTAGKSEINQ